LFTVIKSMKIYAISLQRCTRRREMLQRQLNSSGLEYELFDAIDGQLGQTKRFDQYCPTLSRRRYGKPMSPGQIGCFASHYLIWKKIAYRKQPAIVIEDDVTIKASIGQVLSILEEIINQYEFIRLESAFVKPYKPLSEKRAGHRVVRYVKPPRGTAGYALAPEGAEKLLAKAAVWGEPVDHYIDHYWRHGLKPYAIFPLCIEQNGSLSSEITLKKSPVPPMQKMIREWFRLYYTCRLWMANHVTS